MNILISYLRMYLAFIVRNLFLFVKIQTQAKIYQRGLDNILKHRISFEQKKSK